jgi:hypothetical protein
MRKQWFGSILALAGAAGMALAQSPPSGDAYAPGSYQTPAAIPQAPAGGCADGGCAAPGGWWHTDPREGVPDNVLYARSEYLLWFFKNSHPRTLVGLVPANVAAANGNNLPPGSITSLVGGGPGLDYDRQSGVRLGVGVWLDPGQCLGLEAEGFWLERGAFHAHYASSGDPVIGPVYNDLTRETIILFADPASQRSSTMNVDANNRLWGAELNARRRVCSIVSDRLDAFVGFRYLSFDESVNVSGTTTTPPNSGGFDFSYFDSWGVHNQFYGGQVGLQGDFAWGRWFTNLKAKLALGDMRETARLDGSTTVVPGNQPAFTLPGGVLVQPSNLGSYSKDRFAVVSEITLNTGLQVTDHLRVFIGYDFLYVDHLARAAHQTDGVDSSQIVVLNPLNRNANATRPQFAFGDGRFWSNGLNLGMEFRY